MKKLLLFAAVVTLFSACKFYQISTLSSSNTKKNESTGVFRLESDSLILSYSFNGENSPINIEIFNKLNEPVYVNWAKSAVISGDQAHSYLEDEIQIEGTSSSLSTAYGRRGNMVTDGAISATAKLSREESFIPPHSKITKTSYVLKKVGMNEVEKSVFKSAVPLTYADGSGQFYGKNAIFTTEDSPLKFKSYLTLYTLKDNQPRSFSSEQDFYVSSVTKSAESPGQLLEFSNNRGDIIVIGHATGYAKTMAVVGLAGAIGALTATQVSLKDKNKTQ